MKVNREQLKALIKECLVEILNEGLAGGLAQAPSRGSPSVSGFAESKTPSRRGRPDFDPRLDTPVGNGRGAPTAALKEAIKRESGGNPIMAAIFADTARTTLAEQLAHGDAGTPPPGSGGGGRLSQQEQFNGTPEQAFGEDSVGRWAHLAFPDAPGEKTA